MLYHVTKQYGQNTEIKAGSFKTLIEAKAFVDTHITQEALMKIKVIYRIKEFDDIIEEFDSLKITEPTSQETQPSSSASGKNSEAAFRPSPLHSTLKPTGMQQNWVTPKDHDKKDK